MRFDLSRTSFYLCDSKPTSVPRMSPRTQIFEKLSDKARGYEDYYIKISDSYHCYFQHCFHAMDSQHKALTMSWVMLHYKLNVLLLKGKIRFSKRNLLKGYIFISFEGKEGILRILSHFTGQVHIIDEFPAMLPLRPIYPFQLRLPIKQSFEML